VSVPNCKASLRCWRVSSKDLWNRLQWAAAEPCYLAGPLPNVRLPYVYCRPGPSVVSCRRAGSGQWRRKTWMATAVGPHQMQLAGYPVRDICAAATLPTRPHPAVEFVKINRPGQHQQSGRDEVFASPGATREPTTGKDAGAFDADVVAALSHLTQVIDQRLQFGPLGGLQRFAVKLGTEDLVFG
jgi:hypothetical protein